MFARIARFPRIAAAAGGAVILATGMLARTVTAWNPQPDPPFGMVGIVEGQTARLNLVNTGSPTATLTPPPCRARLSFMDGDGNVIAGRDVEVEAGQSTFLDFSPVSVPVNTLADLSAPIRSEIRAQVTFVDGELAPPCRANTEIFDNATGKTTVIVIPPPCREATCRVDQ